MADNDLIVVCLMDTIVVPNKKTKCLIPTLPNHITQEEPKEIPPLRRSKRVMRPMTQGVMITAVEVTGCELKASSLAYRNFQ